MGFSKDEAFPSAHLSAADLKGQDVTVTIKSFEWVEVGEAKDKKVLCNFEGAKKGLVLNVTNWNTIEKLYGQDTDGWIGQQITLFPTTTDFKGELKDAIRIRNTLPQAAQQAQAPAKQQPVDEDLDDSIPF